MIPVALESPYAGNVERNLRYACACLRDCLIHYDEAPLASHVTYTRPGVLNDGDHFERELGIEAGLLWNRYAQRTVVYVDLGISRGMQRGIEHAAKLGRRIEMRRLPEWEEGSETSGTFDPGLLVLVAKINELQTELARARAQLADMAGDP